MRYLKRSLKSAKIIGLGLIALTYYCLLIHQGSEPTWNVIESDDTDPRIRWKIEQKQKYWVISNHIPGTRLFKGNESITFCTHGEYRFLENLVEVVNRWKGPISAAMYTPGDDYRTTLESIEFLRRCRTPLIAELVTFHFVFDHNHLPKSLKQEADVKCSDPPPWNRTSYRQKNNLYYPINVARNTARPAATTHFVISADMELYPSDNFIPDFLEMAHRLPSSPRPRAYALPPFEVEQNVTAPRTKTELLKLLEAKSAVPFHQIICPKCHTIPELKRWMSTAETDRMEIFTQSKRSGDFYMWEPFYVTDHDSPLYEERMVWEGAGDQLPTLHAMCLLDYDFIILNNAFLVHRPGIKIVGKDSFRNPYKKVHQEMRYKVIGPEHRKLYGEKSECYI